MQGIELLPLATELERFEMGELSPVPGTLTYGSLTIKGFMYLSASATEVIALKTKKVTKAGGGVEVGSTVLKVAAHLPVERVSAFIAK
jgi:hypothetical protein